MNTNAIPGDAIFAINLRGGSKTRNTTKEGCYVSVVKSGTERHTPSQVSITIYQHEMEKCRWLIGDRVDVLMSNASMEIWIRRNPEGNYKLSATGSMTGKQREAANGKSMTGAVKFSKPKDWALKDGDRFKSCKSRTNGEWLVISLA